jgi:HprK-related kinase B
MANDSPDFVAQHLIGGAELNHDLRLQSGGCGIHLRSNSAELIARLRQYFAHIVRAQLDTAIEVIAVERDAVELPFELVDWKREPGKSGRKDAIFDLPGARLIHKVRTGMNFLQSPQLRIAAGPCVAHDNQVINFINNQLMTELQNDGWLNCHAAAFEYQGQALAIAGFSGGGKSTLMLHLLEDPATRFMTNDRLFIKREGEDTQATGIPKLPRINPGTILNNPRLQPLIDPERRDQLAKMDRAALWELEEKFDADIESLYGPDRIQPESRPLKAFLVLNWQRDSDAPLTLNRVQLDQRPDLLAAIMKSPGPFYQRQDGSFLSDDNTIDPAPYLSYLRGVTVYEASGGIDFDALAERFKAQVEQHD